MGIATTAGVVRDFAGPYTVNTGGMAFGAPTRYLQLDPDNVRGESWDSAVARASHQYGREMHILCWNNCHSHVALALRLMQYDGSTSHNAWTLGFKVFLRARYVGVGGFLKTWLPFLLILAIVLGTSVFA